MAPLPSLPDGLRPVSRSPRALTLDPARALLKAAGIAAGTRRAAGRPDEAPGRLVETGGVDLTVMGACGHSLIRTLVIGSTTTGTVRSCKVPVLLLRRPARPGQRAPGGPRRSVPRPRRAARPEVAPDVNGRPPATEAATPRQRPRRPHRRPRGHPARRRQTFPAATE